MTWGWKRLLTGTLWVAAILAVAQAVSLLVWFWPGSLPDTNTSGVWLALADDTAHGVFYRPILSGLGVGGTRYMPLFFALHAGLIHLGVPAIPAGVALTLASAGVFLLGVFWLAVELGAPVVIALPATLALLGTITMQMLLLTVRGDFLAAGLGFLGVTFAVRAKAVAREGWLVLAAVAFAAAILTKLTSVFGVAGVSFCWLSNGEGRRAIRLSGITAGVTLAGIAVAYWASEGRILASFRAVATGGGDPGFAFRSPLRLLQEVARDPLLCVVAVGAASGLFFAGRGAQRTLVGWLVAVELAVALVIFASPGTGKNHLLEFEGLAALALAVSTSRRGTGGVLGVGAMAVVGVASLLMFFPGFPSVRSFFAQQGRPQIDLLAPLRADLAGPAGPIFSENPAIAIALGQRPFVADAFNLQLLMRDDAEVRASVLTGLKQANFGAVVLANWPLVFGSDTNGPSGAQAAAAWAAIERAGEFSPDFYSALQQHYRIVRVRRPWIFLAPATDRPNSP